MKRSGLKKWKVTDHALFEMKRRGITEDQVRDVLVSPEQEQEVRPGRHVYQSRTRRGSPAKQYLIRVFVDIDREPPEVVTAYLTSRVEKYWRRV